ncbi:MULTISPECIES: DUF3558 domain-containing protein [unclassified Saccharothrix]|uniref:DUF3558 domain-containing protein n=1 Tax=unclassified Saccharothrix TaxID=2593673 RepID=UPI00307EDAC0
MPRRSTVAVVALLAVAGCGAEPTTSGSPRTAPATPTSTEEGTRPASSRPRELKLDGREPCTLLTADQLARLDIDRPGKPLEVAALRSTGCNWITTRASSSLVPVMAEGIEAWTEGKRTGRPQEIDPISGFPAITVTVASNAERCDVMVDTGAGQYLAAGFSVTAPDPSKVPKPCDGARQLAEAAMQNLLK